MKLAAVRRCLSATFDPWASRNFASLFEALSAAWLAPDSDFFPPLSAALAGAQPPLVTCGRGYAIFPSSTSTTTITF